MVNRVEIFDIYTREHFDMSDPLYRGRHAIIRMCINGLPVRLEGYGANNDEAFRDLIGSVATAVDVDFLRIAHLAAPVAIPHPNIVQQRHQIRHEATREYAQSPAATASPSRSQEQAELAADRAIVDEDVSHRL